VIWSYLPTLDYLHKELVMKILLAVDGSTFSKKMLAYLATHDTLFTTAHEYTVFNAQPPLPPRARSALGKDTVEKYYVEEGDKVLNPVRKFLKRHGIEAKSSFKVGHAGELISKAAQDGEFDLLVMGSHGNGAIMTLVMGSVATQVLAHCKVPVLVVR
jgi:nucleotide-binding universal stress UspA family protein